MHTCQKGKPHFNSRRLTSDLKFSEFSVYCQTDFEFREGLQFLFITPGMVKLKSQLDGTYNQLDDKPLGMHWRDIPEYVN